MFSTHHIQPSAEKLVVTRADSATRRVYELNAAPAAQEYADLIGLPIEALDLRAFAAYPLAAHPLHEATALILLLRRLVEHLGRPAQIVRLYNQIVDLLPALERGFDRLVKHELSLLELVHDARQLIRLRRVLELRDQLLVLYL